MTRNVIRVCGLLLTLLIVQPRPADAQAEIRVSAGATFATLEGDDAKRAFGGGIFSATDLGNEPGFFAGASLSVPLGGILSISPGLYFVQKGTSFRDRVSRENSVELSYIEIPVTIGVAVTGADLPFGVRLFAGPEIAFEINCELEVGSGPDVGDPFGQFDDCGPLSEANESENQRKSIDFGLVFGADVSFGDFFVNGGLDLGLTTLDDSDTDWDFKNSAWFVGAGVVIGG